MSSEVKGGSREAEAVVDASQYETRQWNGHVGREQRDELRGQRRLKARRGRRGRLAIRDPAVERPRRTTRDRTGHPRIRITRLCPGDGKAELLEGREVMLRVAPNNGASELN